MSWLAIDLDGCLSDDRGRKDLERAGRLDEYHARFADDPPMNHAIMLNPPHDVTRWIVTGRPERHRAATIEWLVKHYGKRAEYCGLLMRPDGNTTPTPELKLGLLMGAGLRPVDCAGAYDDRADVLRAYRNWGISLTWLVNGEQVSRFEPKADERAEAARKLAGVGSVTRGRGDPAPQSRPRTAAEILESMAATFRERNAEYKSNYKMISQLVRVLFPDGVPPELVVTDQWHIFELKLVKLSRFAISGLTHVDSIHDDGVYSAMIQSILEEQRKP